MDVAERLLTMMYQLVDKQRNCADRLNHLASELEKRRKAANKQQVAGSALSVIGAAAMTVAGVCTGGAAVVPLVAAGKVGSMIGLANNLGSEVADAVVSNIAMNTADKILEDIRNLEKEIQTLYHSVVKEGEKTSGSDSGSSEDFVVEQIVRAMAKRYGLELHCEANVRKLVSYCFKDNSFLDPALGLKRYSVSSLKLCNLVCNILLKTRYVKRKVVTMITSTASRGAAKVATSIGSKASKKAVKYVTRGAVGLLFSVPELVYNCVNLNNCETDDSRRLRETAKSMVTDSTDMKNALDEVTQLLEKLEEVKRCIENSDRCSEQKKQLIEFVIEMCEDPTVVEWLRENSECEAFLKLVETFDFLKQALDEEKDKIVSETIHITFVAHGAIEQTMIPANTLRPLSSIEDVVVYSPWNCTINADVAYGVATGIIEPQHRVFRCGEKDNCQIPDKKHQPSKLPDCWNSMKTAEGQMIPNIRVSTLKKPKDGAWEAFMSLQDKHGRPEINRIVIPFILPGGLLYSLTAPFFVVTLALSLVLYFSKFKATVHLVACLGKISARTTLDEGYLKEQYACTIDNTGMTSSKKMMTSDEMLIDKHTNLYRSLYTLFG